MHKTPVEISNPMQSVGWNTKAVYIYLPFIPFDEYV